MSSFFVESHVHLHLGLAFPLTLVFFLLNFVASSRLPGEVVDTFHATSIPDLTNRSLNLPKRNLLKKKRSHPRRMKPFKINS